jgi:hypothetical protein
MRVSFTLQHVLGQLTLSNRQRSHFGWPGATVWFHGDMQYGDVQCLMLGLDDSLGWAGWLASTHAHSHSNNYTLGCCAYLVLTFNHTHSHSIIQSYITYMLTCPLAGVVPVLAFLGFLNAMMVGGVDAISSSLLLSMTSLLHDASFASLLL